MRSLSMNYEVYFVLKKKNSNRKRSILKDERTFERKSKQNIEDTDDKDTDMECGAVCSRNMDNEERRYKRLEAFEMWTWRRMEKGSWTEHKTNEEISETIGDERSLIRTIKPRQQKWIGHTLRGESLLKTVIEGKMLGSISRGRPRQMMLMVEGYTCRK